MDSDVQPSFNADVLRSLREQVSMPANQVSDLTSIPRDLYISFESGDAEPAPKDVKRLAAFFRVKEFIFYRKRPAQISRKINFRQDLKSFRGDPGPIIDAIGFATQIQKLLHSVVDISTSWGNRNVRPTTISNDAETIAAEWRNILSITDRTQVEIPSHSAFFSFLRSRIESLGISVIVSSFEEKYMKGLVVGSETNIPVILINSYKQQRSSRTFTLAHEFGHVLVGNDDVSNPYEPDGITEKFCNRFAAALLMPRELLESLLQRRATNPRSNAGIKWLSNKLKVSMEAVVLRLQECGLVPDTFWKQWKSQFTGQIPLPSEEPEGGGGDGSPVDQGLTKLARYGFLFGLSISEGMRRKKLPYMAVYKASRLKPEYIEELARAARERLVEMNAYAAG